MERYEEEVATDLKTVVEYFDKEDRSVRERQIRNWRRLKLYWNNFSQFYWDEVAQDYRLYNRDDENYNGDQLYYDRPVNVFRAFLETIIAALSIQVPAISCAPDDADNPLDISTAEAGNRIASLVYKHNNVIFLWLHALYIYCTEGMIACHIEAKKSAEYGTYKTPKYEETEEDALVCPECEERLADELFSAHALGKYNPNENDNELVDTIESEGPVCPECGTMLDPNLQKSKLVIKRLVGETDNPKSRICLNVWGGLYVKVANYAIEQSGTPYLIWAYETHYVSVLNAYPRLREKLPQGGWSNIGVNDPYEQYGRLNVEYRGEYPTDQVTCKHAWLRPEAFFILPNEKAVKYKKKFPNGVKVVMANDIVAEYCTEALDDHWVLTRNPMSDYLNHDPLGELLTNIQDIVNDLISLTLQTIEHGIEQTWVDPSVVDVDAQAQVEAAPGTITAVKAQGAGKRLSDAFYSTKTATLAPEVFQMFRIVQELGQFVSGAMPSLFGGGANRGGSRTASEYNLSRSMALQRLQTPWKMMTIWWKGIFARVIPMYMDMMETDERIVTKDADGNFINTFIRKAELVGKIGDIELDASEQLPISDEQQREIMMELMQLNIAEIQQALTSPENLPFIRKLVNIPQFRIPGEADRQKQHEEINELINSEPVMMPPDEAQVAEAIANGQQPQPIEMPSVEVDPIVDNHAVEAETCRSWLIGAAGRLAKIENPTGYRNVVLHMKLHMDILTQRMAQMQASQAAMAQSGKDKAGPGGKGKPDQKPNSAETMNQSPESIGEELNG